MCSCFRLHTSLNWLFLHCLPVACRICSASLLIIFVCGASCVSVYPCLVLLCWHALLPMHLFDCAWIFLATSSLKYPSAGIGICFTWWAVLVMIHFFIVTRILYDLLLRSFVPCSTTVPCVHSLLSFCWLLHFSLQSKDGIFVSISVLISNQLPFYRRSIMIIIIIK